MKRVFTFILLCFVSVTLMSQTFNKNIADHTGFLIFSTLTDSDQTPDGKIEWVGHYVHNQSVVRDRQIPDIKTTITNKPKLDSIIVIPADGSEMDDNIKHEYIYNDYGKETQHIVYCWDEETSKWSYCQKFEHQYDANGNLALYAYYSGWNRNTHQWNAYEKQERTFDFFGNETLYIYYRRDYQTNELAPISKLESFYNFKSVIMSLQSKWDSDNKQWELYGKAEYNYDFNGRLLYSLEYHCNDGSSPWILDWKREYTFNTNGAKTKEILYVWMKSYWDAVNENLWTYNDKGILLQEIWRSCSDTLDVLYSYEFTFDNAGNLTQESYYLYMGGNNYYYWYKYDYKYDDNMNMTEVINNKWNTDSNRFIPYAKAEYTYDNSYSFGDLIVPANFAEREFRHRITNGTGYDWDKISSQWVESGNTTYYYSGIDFSDISDNRNSNISIYPNPASDFIRFETCITSKSVIVDLMDVHGKKVVSQELNRDKQISVSQLSSGIYFYKVKSDDKIQNGKIIIQNR